MEPAGVSVVRNFPHDCAHMPHTKAEGAPLSAKPGVSCSSASVSGSVFEDALHPSCPMSHLKEWHLGTLLSGLHPHPSQRTWSSMLMCAAILTHVACVHTPCEHAKRAQLCPSPRMREVSNEPFPSTGEGAALGDICPTRRHLSNMDYISVTGCHELGIPERVCWKTSGRSLNLCWGQLEGGVK